MSNQETLPGMDRSRPRDGDDLKREGIDKALKNERQEWRRRASLLILSLAQEGKPFTADDIRRRARHVGLADPHHPNVWGAIIRTELHAGIIERTGDYRKGSRPEQHSRMIPVYRGQWPYAPSRPIEAPP